MLHAGAVQLEPKVEHVMSLTYLGLDTNLLQLKTLSRKKLFI